MCVTARLWSLQSQRRQPGERLRRPPGAPSVSFAPAARSDALRQQSGFPGPFPQAFGVRVAHRALAVARFARPWTSLREQWITRPAACPAGRWTNGWSSGFSVLRIATRLDHRLTTALPTLPTAAHDHLSLDLTFLTTRCAPSPAAPTESLRAQQRFSVAPVQLTAIPSLA